MSSNGNLTGTQDNLDRNMENRNLQNPQPCAHCEEELPLACFDSPDSLFCKACTQEIVEVLRKKYGLIQAAHFRAQLRHKTRHLFDDWKQQA